MFLRCSNLQIERSSGNHGPRVAILRRQPNSRSTKERRRWPSVQDCYLRQPPPTRAVAMPIGEFTAGQPCHRTPEMFPNGRPAWPPPQQLRLGVIDAALLERIREATKTNRASGAQGVRAGIGAPVESETAAGAVGEPRKPMGSAVSEDGTGAESVCAISA